VDTPLLGLSSLAFLESMVLSFFFNNFFAVFFSYDSHPLIGFIK
jgi:hypothetical protein